MSRRGRQWTFYTRDWFLGLVLSLVLLAAWLFGQGPLQSLARATYDSAVGLTYRRPVAARKLVLVQMGAPRGDTVQRRPRDRLAALVKKLHADGAQAVALLMPLARNGRDPGIVSLRHALDALGRLHRSGVDTAAVRRPLLALEQRLDTDARLTDAIRDDGPVFLGARVSSGGSRPALPAWAVRQALGPAGEPGDPRFIDRLARRQGPLHARSMQLPLKAFAAQAGGIGFLEPPRGQGGPVRRVPLVVRYRGRYYPSLPLLLASRLLGVPRDAIRVEPGRGVRIGSTLIASGPGLRLRPGFYRRGRQDPFHQYTLQQVENSAPASAFRGRIVLVGLAPALAGGTWATPVGQEFSRARLTANLTAAVADQDYYRRPSWALWVELAAGAAVIVVAAGIAPFVPPLALGIVVVIAALGEFAAEYYLMVGAHQWVDLAVPAVLMVVAAAVVGARRALRGQQEGARVDEIEEARQLGLTYQSHGQLDLAMDKFRELPVTDTVLELMYNLALDYERRGRQDRALSLYDHMLENRDGYRDVRARRRQAVEQGGMNGGPRGNGRREDGLPRGADGEVLTHLGRYSLKKYLGRGAMGAVYLGEDPRIHRVVALKTMALSERFAEDEVDEARQRFFREAEVAGRLSHPSIVTIYDAGEDQTLAYIAMEYLEGTDLRPYTRKGSLLAVNRVMEIVAQVAEGLDYAHRHGVVHRDVKASNVILDPNTRRAKIGDFGIARIVSSRRTHTGAVMGTPPYMSPEQLAGKRVDGRSDVFSLGVLLYELIAGRRPFEGETISTLMYRITHEPHPDIMDVRGGIPVCLRNLINKALQKDPDKRFQTAAEMRTALLRCIRNNYTVTSGVADTGARF
ncbi:MAG TPA: serine/threonine-protein kinase [Gammaproteobacteria bacterium]|nr:serine/threonine-protein kinase [Gammaproteobacteria bacterium]